MRGKNKRKVQPSRIVKSMKSVSNIAKFRSGASVKSVAQNSHVIHLVIFTLALFTFSCRHKKDLTKSDDSKHTTNPSHPLSEKLGVSKKEINHNKLYSFVDDWYGSPYKYGGCQKTGVDCSCFADNLYDKVYGVKIGRTAGEIYKACDKVKTDHLKQGDFVFFITNGKSISHVGVYLKDNKFAHASTSKGVIVSDLNETYYKKYFHSAGRLRQTLSWKD
jgi:murein DD-endopeptidase / murein LD-carboxypeptidase